MGQSYPKPKEEYAAKLKKAFRAKSHLSDKAEIEKALEFGEYMKKELEALQQLRVYRAMKRRYY